MSGTNIVDKIGEKKLRWFGHVMRKDGNSKAMRVAMTMNAEGNNRRRRQNGE